MWASAAFEAQYPALGTVSPVVTTADIDVMLTIDPPSAARRYGTQRRARSKGATTLTSSNRRTSSAVSSVARA